MPLGLNRTDLNTSGDNFRLGIPVDTTTIEFGTPVDLTTIAFGTPVTLPLNVGNDVTLPHEFGNEIEAGN